MDHDVRFNRLVFGYPTMDSLLADGGREKIPTGHFPQFPVEDVSFFVKAPQLPDKKYFVSYDVDHDWFDINWTLIVEDPTEFIRFLAERLKEEAITDLRVEQDDVCFIKVTNRDGVQYAITAVDRWWDYSRSKPHPTLH